MGSRRKKKQGTKSHLASQGPTYNLQTPSGMRSFNTWSEWSEYRIHLQEMRKNELRERQKIEISGKKDLLEAQSLRLPQKLPLDEAQSEESPHDKTTTTKKKKKKKKKTSAKEKNKDGFVQEKRTGLNDELIVRENGGKYLCVLCTRSITWSLTLLLIEANGDTLSKDSISTVQLPGYCVPYVGFGSLESKCYVIGGDVLPQGSSLKGLRFPRKVFVCDLTRRVKSWEEGPMLHGGKPRPIVATVNGKLYALAGTSKLWNGPHEKPTNLFEVFEPKYGMWRVLPNPPFLSLYKKGFLHPKFRGNTVIGSVIYLQIGEISDPTLYSFNVDSERWTEYGSDFDGSCFPEGSDDLTLHNLRVAEWRGRADVVDYLMLRTSGKAMEYLTVFAYDLSRNVASRKDDFIGGSVFVDEDDCKNEVSEESFHNDEIEDRFRNEESEVNFYKDGSENSFRTEESIHNEEIEATLHNEESEGSFRSEESIHSEEIEATFHNEESEDEFFKDDSEYSFYTEDSEYSFYTEESEVCFENGESDDSSEDGEPKKPKEKVSKYERYNYDKELYVLMVDDDSVTVPVHGLTNINRRISLRSSLCSFVTHLGDTLFSLVSSHPSCSIDDKQLMHVRVCMFETSLIELSDGIKFEERYVAGHNVREVKWAVPDMESILGWCKVPNDGRQCQFRRPQLQYGKKSNDYPDNVAGQIIQKKNTFHRYVRRVNLPQH